MDGVLEARGKVRMVWRRKNRVAVVASRGSGCEGMRLEPGE